MFVDEIKVYAKAGHGGKGCVSFLREAYRPKGGPAGGNGGKGGDVILEADHDLNNLIAQFFQPRLISENGGAGMSKGMDGKAGKDLIIKVPCGTLVWRVRDTTPLPEGVTARSGARVKGARAAGADDADDVDADSDADADADSDSADVDSGAESSDGETSGRSPRIKAAGADRPVIRNSAGVRALEIDLESDPEVVSKTDDFESRKELVCDLTENGQRYVLCKGGRGGLGNRNFATSRNQSPRFAQPGEVGIEGDYVFELRIVAEVGLVGYPNAGKSTLLSAISKARPKIAPYPFTTLTPQIGIVEYPDWHRLTVCDVPGLIEGAHQNVGLGHAFLRHIRRCQILVFLVDMAGTDAREPWDDYRKLVKELELYDPSLLDRPQLVAANKMDEPNAEANLKVFKRKFRKLRVLPISAAFGEGIPTFREAIREAVATATSDPT